MSMENRRKFWKALEDSEYPGLYLSTQVPGTVSRDGFFIIICMDWLRPEEEVLLDFYIAYCSICYLRLCFVYFRRFNPVRTGFKQAFLCWNF